MRLRDRRLPGVGLALPGLLMGVARCVRGYGSGTAAPGCSPPGSDPGIPESGLAQVREKHRLIEAANRDLPGAVAQARTEGATWDDIGRVLGTTRQAAHQRFGT